MMQVFVLLVFAAGYVIGRKHQAVGQIPQALRVAMEPPRGPWTGTSQDALLIPGDKFSVSAPGMEGLVRIQLSGVVSGVLSVSLVIDPTDKGRYTSFDKETRTRFLAVSR